MAPAPTPARPHGEMNVTPMLDVLLVLLVIFMVLAMRSRHTIDAQLPVPCAAPCDGGDAPLVLEVRPGPTYRLNREPVPAARLAERLAAVFGGRPDAVLHVAGGEGVTYQQVIAAMDVARGAGVRVIGLAPRTLARAP
jgi:biopolymer transport protein TolR